MTVTAVSTSGSTFTDFSKPTADKRNAAMPEATAAEALSAKSSQSAALSQPEQNTWPDQRRVPLWGTSGILTPSIGASSGPPDTDVSTMSVAERLRAMETMQSIQQAGDSTTPSALPPSTSDAWRIDVQA